MSPLVSVICLCYNHELYLRESVLSVIGQTYANIEIILVDDCSRDGSTGEIARIVRQFPHINCLFLKNNLGNCTAFNRGLALAKGKYIIDLATDDVLHHERVEKGVIALETAGADFGVNFCDAAFIDRFSKITGNHYKRDKQGKLIDDVPQGDVYKHLLGRYFICPPTMMIKKEVLDDLGGYDGQLAYEDFDFWVRSSRKYKYVFTDQVLVSKRILTNSLSKQQYAPGSRQLHATYLVCEKAFALNKNRFENKGLKQRVTYELRQAIRSNNKQAAQDFLKLLKRLEGKNITFLFYKLLIKLK